MDLNKNKKINILFILFVFCFEVSQNIESLFSYGMTFAKSYKLNNGNILVVWTLGINIYDNSGINLLYNHNITENPITTEDKGRFTNYAQFSNENNRICIVLVYHILYILNSDGKYLFEYKIEDDTSQVKFIH